MTEALQIRDLVVRYADIVAVDRVSLEVQPGQIVALLGANGAGKTSTLEAALGLRRPSSGTIRALGGDPSDTQVRGRTGVMLQSGGLYPSARPLAWLSYLARLYPRPGDPATLLEQVGIDPSARTTNRRLSGGEQQRVKLAAALLPQPELLYLDEPTAGVDALGRRPLLELVRACAERGTGVVLTTHVLADVTDLADSVVVLQSGHVRARGTVDELTGAAQAVRFTATPGLPTHDLHARLGPSHAVRAEADGTYVVDGPVTPDVLAAVTAWCADLGVLPQGLTTNRSTLEEILTEAGQGSAPLEGMP